MTIRIPHGSSDDAWEDPTHVRAYFANSFGFFPSLFIGGSITVTEGIGELSGWLTWLTGGNAHLSALEILAKAHTQRNVVQEMVVELPPVKPIREPNRGIQDNFQITIQFSSQVGKGSWPTRMG